MKVKSLETRDGASVFWLSSLGSRLLFALGSTRLTSRQSGVVLIDGHSNSWDAAASDVGNTHRADSGDAAACNRIAWNAAAADSGDAAACNRIAWNAAAADAGNPTARQIITG